MSDSQNSSGIFAENDPLYEAIGISTTPIKPGTKRPVGNGWTERRNLDQEARRALRQQYPDAGIGVLAGAMTSAGNVFGFNDVDRPGFQEFVRRVVGQTVSKRGQKGSTLFCQFEPGLKSCKVRPKGSKAPVVEMMIDSGMTVVPPSRHPAGMRYQWEGKALHEVDPAELPLVNAAQQDFIKMVCAHPAALQIAEGGPDIKAHDLMLSLTSSGVAKLDLDLARMAYSLNGLFPAGYAGNTPDETLEMLESAREKGLGTISYTGRGPPIVPVSLESLPAAVTEATCQLIIDGDDAERPMGTEQPRFRSRSEAVFRVACDLARAGCAGEVIAGILINPEYAISASVLDKRAPPRHALKQADSAWAAITDGWPDVRRDGNPAPTMRNAAIALQRLGLAFAHDLFRYRKIVNGNVLAEHEGEISDDACAMLRSAIIDTFNFDPKAENVRDAVTQLCLEHSFHPIREMLNALVWDGIPRLDRWLSTYLGADDNELNRAIGAIMLIAAVRRVRQPGVKFDTIVILEGKQGTGKSTALQILAGPGNHSDNEILTLSTKEQMEAMEGVWTYELSEISGLSKAEVERTKAFASRQSDKSRMSYGRFSERRDRQVIFVGTTNDDKYLRDRTGNRRFLPVRTGVIELEALRRDRDQLLAEAAMREAQGDEITLPQELWADAAAEQEDRVEEDPWLEKLMGLNGKAHGDEVRLHTSNLLGGHLGIDTERQHSGHAKRLTALMRSLGWEPAKFKVAGQTLRGFRRPKPDDHRDDQEF